MSKTMPARRMAAALVPVSVVASFLLLLTFGFYYEQQRAHHGQFGSGFEQLRSGSDSGSNRRLLRRVKSVGAQCTSGDIVLNHGVTPPLPNGIPTYTMNVLNLCAVEDGCPLGNIHLSCGEFSSARLINPRIFRRLSVGDCLVNDGRPLLPGYSVSFQYANSFPYSMEVSNATCIPPS